MNKWHSNTAPRIASILEKNMLEASYHVPIKAADYIYQVVNMCGEMYSIDLKARTCSGRK